MRIIGIFLIFCGLLLCVTIFLAPVGIFIILIGLVFIVLGGRRRTVINNVVQVSAAPGGAPMQANIVDGAKRGAFGRGNAREVPIPQEPPSDAMRLPALPVIDVTPPRDNHFQRNGFVYDRTKWDALLRYDTDISRVAKALEGYDQKYTDEFAAAYLAINDKNYLPMIIQKILESAKRDSPAQRRM